MESNKDNAIVSAKGGEVKNFNITDFGSVLDLATELQKFVKEQRLTINIQGKDYPMVEAWQFAGMRLGIVPRYKSLFNESTYTVHDVQGKQVNHYLYKAEVELVDVRTGNVVGGGAAICTNLEIKKRTFDEYAIASMAQTRAISKAYRLMIGFLFKAAGFEATPAEEMDSIPNEEEAPLTDKQEHLIRDLLDSPAIPEELRKKTLMALPGMSKQRASDAITYFKELTKQQQGAH